MKINFFFFLIIGVFLIDTAFAGVTNPLPTEIELLKGESARFKFQIQAVAHPYAVRCTYSLEEEPIFRVSFDSAETIVEGGKTKDVYGTVTAPRKLDYGGYSATFCVSCKDIQTPPQPGANVEILTCGLPININVVKERTRENMFVPPKPREPLFMPFVGAVIIIIILLMIILYFLIKNRKKEKKEKIEEKAEKKSKSEKSKKKK